jgi:hypothetical protein
VGRLLTNILNPASSLDDLEHHKCIHFHPSHQPHIDPIHLVYAYVYVYVHEVGGIGESVKKITEAVAAPSGWGFSSMVSVLKTGIG